MAVPKTITLRVEGDEITMDMPILTEDRVMTPSEQYLASCFAVWLAAQEGDVRGDAVREAILNLANSLLCEVEENGEEKPN